MKIDKLQKETFYAAKNLMKIWYIKVDKIVISKLAKTKTNSTYVIGIKTYKTVRPLVLIMSKMGGYLNIFKVKEGDRDKNNKLITVRIECEKLLGKYKAIWNKKEDLKNIELNARPVYNDIYKK